MKKLTSLNVFGEALQPCCHDPNTGFFRDGHCNTCAEDVGSHTVCVQVTDEFLTYSASVGNDLSTPHPEFGFPGLKAGDRWCLCASRWLQAQQENKAPKVFLMATHQLALDIVPFELLKAHALDMN
jgi:uncharacterized protein (DUF2237 family)